MKDDGDAPHPSRIPSMDPDSDPESISFALADRTLLPKHGDVAKIVTIKRKNGRIWLVIYDRLTEPLIVADLDEAEIHVLRQILARVTHMN